MTTAQSIVSRICYIRQGILLNFGIISYFRESISAAVISTNALIASPVNNKYLIQIW